MLKRYADACTEVAGIRDNASEDFIMSSAWRKETRRAAFASGATADEIKAVEAQAGLNR